ncbi:hypothetical protein D9G67_16970 [Escherichia coli]|nr:hypothetical protein [Escherichia coli]
MFEKQNLILGLLAIILSQTHHYSTMGKYAIQIKNSPESLTARLNRISQLLLTDDYLISSSFMSQFGLLYCYQL